MRFLVLAGVVCGALFGGFAAKMHSRWAWAGADVCHDVPCAHYTARIAAIKSQIAQRAPGPVYLALGDSHFEYAVLPPICGRQPINAGIGWATTATVDAYGVDLARMAKPDFIVLSVGANEARVGHAHDFPERLAALRARLADWPVIVMPAPSREMAGPDGLHLTAASYRDWQRQMTDAAQAVCKAD